MASSSSGGIGFVGLLTVLFVALKLTGVIAWPWLVVLSPILLSVVIAVVVLVVLLALAVWAGK